jgi:hypothetical protein
MFGRCRASRLLESRREEGGHTRWVDGGLVSRGEDVEVAVMVEEAVGGIARFGAWCGRDFGGGGGVARPSGRGCDEGVDPDARRLLSVVGADPMMAVRMA